MTDLRELEKRLEEATGPDRELDCLIWGRDRGLEITWQNDCMIAQGEGAIGWIDPGKHQRNFYTNRSERGPGSIPAYTASLDAAVALVERCMATEWPQWERHHRTVYSRPHVTHLVEITVPSSEFRGAHETEAVALLLALARALIAKGDRHD